MKPVSADKQQIKPVVAQLALQNGGTQELNVPEMINMLSKDQIQSVIAYFNNQLNTSAASTSTPLTSMGTITTLPGMDFSTSSLCFVGMLRATGNCLTSQSWVIHSGATHHVSHDRNQFITMTDSLDKSVTLPTGIGVKIQGVGQIRLNDYLILNNVLYIPDFRFNLLSISQLTKDIGCRAIFDQSTCLIQDPIRGLTIGQGEEVSNLFVLDASTVTGSSATDVTLSVNVILDTTLWHNRLGHPSVEKIVAITDVLGFKKRNKEPFHCAVCPLAKQKHLPYISQNNIRDHAFDLLHIDIWGPFSVPTPEGYKYFLTIVDDHTRVTWVYLLRTKSEVLQVFPHFITMVEKQYQTSVKGVRSDNAQELKFTDLYKAKGIQAFHSCPETPQQNSVVERKHQHILNVARSVMFQSHLPLEYWGDCILTEVFLINRLPTPLLQNKSPFQLLTSKLPDYRDLRVFGCLVYSSTSSKNRHMFQPRAKPCVFLGYSAGYKGYKLLDLDTNEVLISRNVVFHEDIFPFSSTEDSLPEDFFSKVDASPNSSSTSDIPVVMSSSPTVANDTPAEKVPASISKRLRLPHIYMTITVMAETEIPYPLAAHLSYDQLSEGYKNYICSISLHH